MKGSKKLPLNRETIRMLPAADVATIAGGASAWGREVRARPAPGRDIKPYAGLYELSDRLTCQPFTNQPCCTSSLTTAVTLYPIC